MNTTLTNTATLAEIESKLVEARESLAQAVDAEALA